MRGPGALQHLDEHPWSAKPHIFSVLLLPPFVGHLFHDDGVAHPHDFMDLATMQTLTMSGEFAFFGRLAPPGGQIALAVLPVKSLLASLLRATLVIVVLGVSRPSLPIQLPKQSTPFLLVGRQFLTEAFQSGFTFPWDDGDGRGTQIGANGVGANGVLGLVIGRPRQGKLHVVTIALPIGSFGSLACDFPTDQAGIFDRVV